jgi:hypothetical protein
MTACVLRFAVPPERLEQDVSRYMEPEIGPTWPQEPHDVVLCDLKPELEGQTHAKPVMKQLEARGFAVFKNKSTTLGALQTHTEWNDAYLEVYSQIYTCVMPVLTFCTCRKQLSTLPLPNPPCFPLNSMFVQNAQS